MKAAPSPLQALQARLGHAFGQLCQVGLAQAGNTLAGPGSGACSGRTLRFHGVNLSRGVS